MDAIARAVLSGYPGALGAARAESLGNRGGFSGARLWRLHTPAGGWCLRAAPPGEARDRVAWRHGLMRQARSAGLGFVPAVLSAGGSTCVEAGGRCWEVQEWMPGIADYRESPTPEKLRAAARALAAVHRAWEAPGETADVAPAVRRRLAAVGAPVSVSDVVRHHPLWGPLARRAEGLVRRWLPLVPGMLTPHARRPARVQPCLRDVWHDHVLFEGERVTGVVDYAAVAADDPATDVARLVGSLVGDDEPGWQTALAAYREVRALSGDDERLARALDRTGSVVALATWLRWLGERTFDDAAAVQRRLGELVRRVEAWGPP